MKVGKSMQELNEGGQLKTFFDRRLIKALGHPVREHLLVVFNERVASASEIGDELGADVSSFYHHIEELEKFECIERVATKKRRGAHEHFFRAKRTVFFDDHAWQKLPRSLKEDLTTTFIQAIFDEAASSVERGIFHRRGDEHVSWTSADFDEAGWKEATALMNQALGRLVAIRKESSARLGKSGEKPVSASVGILAFEREGPGATSVSSKVPGREQKPHQASAQLGVL